MIEQNSKPAFSSLTSVELFAGAGGLALGLEKAGFSHLLLNEKDKYACQTLRFNRPTWQVVEKDVAEIDFKPYFGKVDLLSGGFPCQAFSYAGKREGFADIRGTMFFQFARAVEEMKPKMILGENVKGLATHDNGRTLKTIVQTLTDLGYVILPPKVLNAVNFNVPQKRERITIVEIRSDLIDRIDFHYPIESKTIYTVKDALKKGSLFESDVPESIGQSYSEVKRKVLDLVPQGGCWRHLPEDVAKAYMKGSYFLGGGKTGMARRLSWGEPCLTLTCSPAQNQTERCHPEQTRPLTVREYARIQTFPDDWQFQGAMLQQYKQIGNAVPVNLAYAIGSALYQALSEMK